MPKQHIVRAGECVASIGFEEGFHADTLWKHADNAALRAERESGYVLVPGDTLTIPDLTERRVKCATGRRHDFRRRGVPEKLRVQLLDVDEPRKNLDYILDLDGQKQSGTTDAEGRLEAWIPPGARSGRLLVGEEPPIDLDLGTLEPASTDKGARARLKNLGFLDREDADDEELGRRVTLFQKQSELEPTGTLDDATRRKLTELHGS